jgi:hypothetical protein
MANKRTLSIGIAEGGCAGVMPETFRTIAAWEQAVIADELKGASQMWFFKAINSSNSKGIHVVNSVQGGKAVVAMCAASATKVGAQSLSTIFDVSFFQRMAKSLTTPTAGQEAGGPLTPAALQGAFSVALCSDASLIAKKEPVTYLICRTLFMHRIPAPLHSVSSVVLECSLPRIALHFHHRLNFVIQRAVERPLLIMSGRKFCIRAYVCAFLRPGSRELEVHILDRTISRPNKAPFDKASTDGGVQFSARLKFVNIFLCTSSVILECSLPRTSLYFYHRTRSDYIAMFRTAPSCQKKSGTRPFSQPVATK